MNPANRCLAPLLLLAAAATASEPSAPPAAAPGAAPAPALLPADGRWEALEGAKRGGAWALFEARHGTGWSVFLDPTTGAPRMLAGPGIPLGAAPLDADAAVARSRAFLEELRDLLGVEDPGSFVLDRVAITLNPWGQELIGVDLRQTLGGLELWHQAPGGAVEHKALVRFHYNATLGRLVLLGSDAVPALRLPAATALGEGEAVERALGALGAAAAAPVRVAVRSYVSVRGARAFTAREVAVTTKSPAHDWRVIFDAGTGALEETRDDLRTQAVTGNVSAGSYEYASTNFAVRPARALRVTVVGGGNAVTDQNGNFNIPVGGPGGVNVTGRFSGDWAVVDDVSAMPPANLSFNQAAVPGVPVNIVLNPAPMPPAQPVEFDSAEAAAYHGVTETRFYIRGIYGAGFNGLANMRVNVNLNNTCNAYYQPGAGDLTFFRSGGGCRNSASSDVISHEYGHAFHDWFHGSTNPSGFSEGIGDHIALYRSAQRVMGRGFQTNEQPIRDYRATGPATLTQWPCNFCESHKKGEVWGGFTMDLRDGLVARHGAAIGVPIAENITIAQYSRNPADEPSAVANVYVQDDNDGNLANGTPNCAQITAAANRHSLPIPALPANPCGVAAPPIPAPRFRAPVAVAGLNTAASEYQPTLDGAQKNVWLASNRAGGAGGFDLWTAARASVGAAWGAAAVVAPLNSAQNELYACVHAEGTMMVFSSDRPAPVGGGSTDLYLSTRANPGAAWGAPVFIAELNTAGAEDDPAFSSYTFEIFFASSRAGSLGGGALWRAVWDDANSVWLAPARVAELDTAALEHSPVLSDDGHRLYFSSDRAGGVGSSDFYVAEREDIGGPFTIVRNLTEANTANWEFNGDETSDGFSFFYGQQPVAGGATDLFRCDLELPVLRAPAQIAVGNNLSVTLRRDPTVDLGGIFLGTPLPPTPVPPVRGFLEIAPATLIALANHDANGLVSFNVAIPGGAGITAFFQGFSVDPAGVVWLSNRVSVTIVP
jgi:hypothetical protein